MSSTYDQRKLVYLGIQSRIQAMVDAKNKEIFEKVEYGRRGTVDMDQAGCFILPNPRADQPIMDEFQKRWRRWNYQIFVIYMGEDEAITFDRMEFLTYSVYDLFMEKPEPPQGYGYNRTLNGTVQNLDIGDVNIVGVEDKGWKQVAILGMSLEVRV